MSEKIIVKVDIKKELDQVYDVYNNPIHIVKWSHASDDWHTTSSVNDLRVGGKFSSRMEAKDGSVGFDFEGVYDIVEKTHIKYHMLDERNVDIHFYEYPDFTKVKIIFDAETSNPIEMQEAGWQAILNNFKKYVESL